MTKQEKIEIFANYLPYGVKAEMIDYKTDYVGRKYDEIIGIHEWSKNKDWCLLTDGGSKPSLDRVKLILHPLSDLTNPIKVDGYNDGKEFVPYCMIEDLGLAKTVSLSFASVVFSFNLYYGISISERLSCIKYDLEEEIDKINKLPHSIIKLLYKWHFDIHGLIEQCLAIDINTLK